MTEGAGNLAVNAIPIALLLVIAVIVVSCIYVGIQRHLKQRLAKKKREMESSAVVSEVPDVERGVKVLPTTVHVQLPGIISTVRHPETDPPRSANDTV
ncbi:hypothetical protein E1B28_013056 [Marasmius oreades]|uniref:Uncharacterized protein n=1 Tax=Marasmius oreades TaxID=181124 RepID=A0A9P7RNT3_9AGAR|nr:uncharacterized protein E1B28_013056 [Marasmius oreades]KAG7087074.1 hypothetical protein E1B28_013056 [Marasmius oreades]